MKKLLIILGILVLLVIGVLFVPPIYNRFTKPFFKNTVDAKEWYHQVDCENLTQVRDYCDRRGYSTDYYILVDFSKPSGKKRFFIYDLQRGKRVMSSYCMHGSGKGNTAARPKFSNNPGSGCTSLGRYVMIGKGGKTASYHAHQAVPRGTRDGELMNKRRATRDHEAGNECPNREPQFGQYKKKLNYDFS